MLVPASLVVAVVLVEVVLRLLAPVPFRRVTEPQFGFTSRLHRASDVPGLEYELAPSLVFNHAGDGVQVTTNSHGMRGAEVSVAKPEGVVRIAAVGDSFTFGQGVEDDETYPHVLEQVLNERAPDGRRYEVLNFGVPGYSTAEEAAVLRTKVLRFQPDLVILGYVLNDPDVHSDTELHSYFHRPNRIERFELGRLWEQWERGREVRAAGTYRTYLHDPERAPWKTVVKAFDQIREESRAHGFPVVLVTFPRLSRHESWDQRQPSNWMLDQAFREGKRHGFLTARLDLVIRNLVERPVDITLEAHGHANAQGNEVFGRWLALYLERAGLVVRAGLVAGAD